MTISYTVPLTRAIERMKALLFRRPFEIETWLVVGLSAWLSEILSGGGSGGAGSRWESSKDELAGAAGKVGDWLSNPTVLMFMALGLVFLGVLLLVISWVSARAQFVFLDNVVHGRAAFVEPWKRNGRLGRSLFLWSAVFSFGWLVPIAAIALPCSSTLASLLAGRGFVMPDIAGLLLGGAIALAAVLVLAVIAALMQDFVVPLMYRHGENATQAWARFWPLLSAHAGDFGAFIAFEVLLWLGVGLSLLAIGLLTCCVGLILMAIPYVGAVLLLPVHVSARAFGPEFLRQFGPEWDVFASEAAGHTAEAPAATR